LRGLEDVMMHIRPPAVAPDRLTTLFNEVLLGLDDEPAGVPKPLRHLDDLLVHLHPDNRPRTFMTPPRAGDISKDLDRLCAFLDSDDAASNRRLEVKSAKAQPLKDLDDLTTHLIPGAVPLCLGAPKKPLKDLDDLTMHFIPGAVPLCLGAKEAKVAQPQTPVKQNTDTTLPWFSAWWAGATKQTGEEKKAPVEEKKAPAPAAADGKKAAASNQKEAAAEDEDLVFVSHESLTKSGIKGT
jgi:hypothetical protein